MSNWNAEDYHQNSANQQRWAREAIAKLGFKGNETVLDIGCGDGKVTAEIASLLPNGSILGIDSSDNMIEFAQREFPPSRFSNLRFQYADAKQLNFDNEFDLIVSFSCLHWVLDHLPVLEGIKRSLKPSGKIFLHFGGQGNAAAIQETAKKVIHSEKWSKYFQNFSFQTRFYSDDEYRNLLKQVGLKAKRVELIPIEMLQQGKAGLKGWIRSTGTANYIRNVPENLKQEIIEEIADTYIENHPLDSEGLVRVPMVRLEVEATKV